MMETLLDYLWPLALIAYALRILVKQEALREAGMEGDAIAVFWVLLLVAAMQWP